MYALYFVSLHKHYTRWGWNSISQLYVSLYIMRGNDFRRCEWIYVSDHPSLAIARTYIQQQKSAHYTQRLCYICYISMKLAVNYITSEKIDFIWYWLRDEFSFIPITHNIHDKWSYKLELSLKRYVLHVCILRRNNINVPTVHDGEKRIRFY